ncbi:hypothetical protein VSQ82_20015 [Pseudomonas sp. MS-1(2024)]|uniref:TrlF family AAA-like ATPase n=1 Tax=Pseudomonas sp. MS-1(2024) TaxID=3112251 RepID=UPI002DBAFD74|nr:hypothetical protein [Pseudomonas sp. MS-1(2024)]MEC4169504.1 hypothetical protein [Pseudomonas sp. MS-1(2024)]
MESYSKGALWRKWDLQVQTILDDNYVELSSYYEELKQKHPGQWGAFVSSVGSEELALKYDSKAYFHTNSTDAPKMRAKNYANNFIAFLEAFIEGESCVAITDHNYDHDYLLDELYAAAQGKRISVICGVEINVQGVHMLALFESKLYEKDTFSAGLKTFQTKINVDNKKSGGVLTVSDVSYKKVLDEIASNGGILIYPHCNSNNGLFQERGKTDRTHLADHFNYGDFNILQGKNKSACDKTLEYIRTNSAFKSGACFTLGSDARCLNDILSSDDAGNYTWIKADPTFEGLRQITYEPELRVRIQGSIPEDKPGYQIIDRLEIRSDSISNEDLELNPNLTSIIGGRSTGKSVLLTAVAMRLKTERPINFERSPSYRAFVQNISDSIRVFWKDGEENNNREIEFFQQGYMYELAADQKRLDQLVLDILKLKGKSGLTQALSAKESESKKGISVNLNELFQILEEIKEKNNFRLDKGDEKGVQDEITRLESELKKMEGVSVSDEERSLYGTASSEIESLSREVEILQKDEERISQLKNISLVRDSIDYEKTSVSDGYRTKIGEVFDEIKTEASLKWLAGLDKILLEIGSEITKKSESKLAIESESIYTKVLSAFKDSVQLTQLEEKIKIEKKKLFEIEELIREINDLESQRRNIREKILSAHLGMYDALIAAAPEMSASQDDLGINARITFNENGYRDILQSSLNQQSAANKQLAEYKHVDNSSYMDHVTGLFDRIVDGELNLKSGYNTQSLASALLVNCFYSLTYDLDYEGDNFDQMSDGKRAFVVLKLLLDFSDKDCPILIDQPEDDLDNRAIYLDLVSYLKKKKSVRQVIVATHNPNIVVGADSELVIVANQNGIKSKNHNGKKFEYVSGGLENTRAYDASNEFILESKGIREHVCEILEGGDVAFKLREKKYAIK